MSEFTAKKAHQPPETVVGVEGTAKRNIIRKGGASRERKGDIAGKSVDDGSMYVDEAALDSHDPNYNSEDEAYFVKVPTLSALHRNDIAKSRLTLTQYKKAVQPIIAEFFLSFDLNEVANSLQVYYVFFELKIKILSFPSVSYIVWRYCFHRKSTPRNIHTNSSSALLMEHLIEKIATESKSRAFCRNCILISYRAT